MKNSSESSPAVPAAKLALPRRRYGLRWQLMQLSFTLTAIGLVLLVISMVAVLWLRSNAYHLATQRAPTVVATQRAQIGLQRALAGLRGWVALGDVRFRTEYQAAWAEQIVPAMTDMRRASQISLDLADRVRLAALERLLVELKESQWWVADVAQTPGNKPALLVLRQRVEPIATSIRRATEAIIADAKVAQPGAEATPLLHTIGDFWAAFLTAEHTLTQFVTHGEERLQRAFVQTLHAATEALDTVAAQGESPPLLQQNRITFLRREFAWYEQFAQEAITQRRREDWNVAVYLLRSETVPLTLRVTEELDALAARQVELMRRDTQSVKLAGNSAVILSSVLIVLMAVVAYALASYRAGRIAQPIARLAQATEELATGSLKDDLPVMTDDELGILTEAFNRMRVRLQASEAALRQANQQMQSELENAAEYVLSVLPPKLQDPGAPVRTDWQFIASSQLGGDSFGYHWLDEQRLAIYLLDVCGHGVGASLLSISVHNVLRQRTLPGTHFDNPAEVLDGLNRAFPAEQHHNNFFTIWYGVYDTANRVLSYTCGGHHAAVLVTGNGVDGGLEPVQLGVKNIVIGMFPEATFAGATHAVPAGSRLYLFSDGAFELFNPGGEMLALDGLMQILTHTRDDGSSRLQQVLEQVRAWQGCDAFSDDYSMVEITFA